MAGADYLKCEVCAERLMYEPDRDPEILVVCPECYEKSEVKVNKLKSLLIMCLHGSCTCGAKTPEIEFHKHKCNYRIIKEVLCESS